MAYIISEDAKELLKDAKEFCQNEIVEQAKQYDITGEWPREIYEKAIEMQLHMMDIPEEYGGLGLSHIDQAAIVEQIAWADAGVAVTLNGNGLALKPVLVAGNEEQKQKCCDIIANGGWGAFALTEPDAGCDAANGKTTAVREGDEYVLNGRKCFITNASVADFFVVTAMTNRTIGTHGMSAFLVYKGTPGLSVGRHENKMGVRCSTTSDLVLDNVRIPVENRLGEEGTGFATAMKTLDLARTWCAVIGVGLAQRCIDEAAAYSKQRVQFGKPICRHQSIEFKLADMEIRTEASRQLCAHAITLADMGMPFSKESAAAKCFSGDSVVQTALDAVQILGGYGYSREYPVEKLLRDAKIFQIFEGTNEIQRMVVGRAVIGKL
ncbi:acyl-CoA dehydrogenase family protein [Pseudoflavonifractor sp. An85]|uniref:acyl-CoA dehydrogenase family protein n=1 Tax=Pseudoflavonifractor sp. An85 TaxID=1965661 RepID=UPI000B386458|nr:acyl-CoA dehydrogenase family protein [Pseudoflavonifractor sp. An85]OUN24279.1 acyl-CoA dehydrogenase [Pseudoflavonifractor sp. An85]